MQALLAKSGTVLSLLCKLMKVRCTYLGGIKELIGYVINKRMTTELVFRVPILQLRVKNLAKG